MLKWLGLICLVSVAPLLAAETKILAVAGSTREESVNKKLVKEAANLARQMGADVMVIDLRDYPMPFYDGDLESEYGMPENAKKFRQLMVKSDRIILASPEYNGSIPAVLKNALDWASRSVEGEPARDAFKGKKFAIMSASPGAGGGARGLVHLRTVIENVGGEVVKPEVALPQAFTAFDAQGALQNPIFQNQLRQEIQQLMR